MSQRSGNVLVGCVADQNPGYLAQALRLLQSWRWFAGEYAAAPFRVCVAGDMPSGYQNAFERHGAVVRHVQPFSALHPHSNKLRFLELPEACHADHVLLLDCDTLVVADPARLFEGEGLTGKIADVATVGSSTFKGLFRHFEVPMPAETETCTVSGEPTIPYFNAGVLSFSRLAMRELVPAWIKLNRELVGRLDLLGASTNFCEQASLSVALALTGSAYLTVGNEMNFPAHFRDFPPDSQFGRVDPVIIHYHGLVEDDGLLARSPYMFVDRKIVRFNEALVESWLGESRTGGRRN